MSASPAALIVEAYRIVAGSTVRCTGAEELRENVQIEMRQLQKRLGITTLMVTHDQDEAMTMCDQIAVMNNGRIEQIGSPKDVYERPVTRFVASFIGTSNSFKGKVASRTPQATS